MGAGAAAILARGSSTPFAVTAGATVQVGILVQGVIPPTAKYPTCFN